MSKCKKYILSLALFLQALGAMAQDHVVDSIAYLLEQNVEVESALSFVSESFGEENNLELIELGLDHAIEHDLDSWRILLLLDKSRAQTHNKDFMGAITSAFDALKRMKSVPESRNKLEGRAHFLLSQGLKNIGAYEEAINHRRAQVKWIEKKASDKRIPIISNEIGLLFYKLKEYDSSLVYFKKAVNNAFEINQDGIAKGYYNNVGLAYFQMNQMDSAKIYFHKAMEFYDGPGAGESVFMAGVVRGNLSSCFSPETDGAYIRQLIEANITGCKVSKNDLSLSEAYRKMALFLEKRKDYSNALKYLDSAYTTNIGLKSAGEYDREWRTLRLSIYESYIDVLAKFNRHGEALEYVKKYQLLNDSLNGSDVTETLIRGRTTYQVLGIQNELELEEALHNKSLSRIEMLEKEEELSQLKTISLISFSIFLLIFGVFIFLRMKRRRELEELKNQVLEASVKNKNQRLTTATLSLTRKQEFAEKLMEKLKSIHGLDKSQLAPIRMYIMNEFDMDESILEMERSISELGQEFFDNLKAKYPQLTENDLKLCGLIRQNLTVKQIAIVKNITPESVKIAKNRLRKKLALAPGTDLFAFLEKP